MPTVNTEGGSSTERYTLPMGGAPQQLIASSPPSDQEQASGRRLGTPQHGSHHSVNSIAPPEQAHADIRVSIGSPHPPRHNLAHVQIPQYSIQQQQQQQPAPSPGYVQPPPRADHMRSYRTPGAHEALSGLQNIEEPLQMFNPGMASQIPSSRGGYTPRDVSAATVQPCTQPTEAGTARVPCSFGWPWT